ncbi:hypothetical protein SFRURICE_014339 [Spodoptera frugiperda]|nr:hypothetical protein SFRURICE_014339 [Spodoptera frugiperda]
MQYTMNTARSILLPHWSSGRKCVCRTRAMLPGKELLGFFVVARSLELCPVYGNSPILYVTYNTNDNKWVYTV